jgi:hypothetical protein
VVNETKVLGIIFDSKLTCKLHIASVKKKCLKAMNLVRVVAHTNWGADSTTLLRLYCSVVRSKLDYDYVIYGLAKASYLESHDWAQNAALHVCLGAFSTTPVFSLRMEAWLLCALGFDYTLNSVGTKSNTFPDIYLSLYVKLVSENYEGYNSLMARSKAFV